MPERISNPNHLVDVHGFDRIPDGHIVPQPPRTIPPPEPPPPVSVAERWWAVLFVAIVAAAIVYGSLR